MNKTGASKSMIFLLEFVFVVLFFSICATICVTAFVKADHLSTTNGIKNQAIVQAESAAELIKHADIAGDPLEQAGLALEDYLGAEHTGNNYDYMVYYDETFTPVDISEKENAAHAMFITMECNGRGILEAEIRVDGDLFILNAEKYLGIEYREDM